MKFPTYKELGEIAAKEALDTFEYNGKTLREWIEIISAAELGTNLAEVGTDCISRQQAINKIKPWLEVKGYGWSELNMLRAVINELENMPSIQPERPTGEWIQKPRYEDDEYPDVQPNLKCPFCGYEIGWCDMGNYCARCGADLRGDENE